MRGGLPLNFLASLTGVPPPATLAQETPEPFDAFGTMPRNFPCRVGAGAAAAELVQLAPAGADVTELPKLSSNVPSEVAAASDSPLRMARRCIRPPDPLPPAVAHDLGHCAPGCSSWILIGRTRRGHRQD